VNLGGSAGLVVPFQARVERPIWAEQ